MHDAFLSYSRHDLERVKELSALAAKRGSHVFLDLQGLRAGEAWPSQLGKAIQDSRVFVLCWSRQAAQSDWVAAEWRQALLLRKKIVPWLLDSEPLPGSLASYHGETLIGAVVAAIPRAVLRRRRAIVAAGLAAVTGGVATTMFRLKEPDPAPATQAVKECQFQGHVMSEGDGRPVRDALVEVNGSSVRTDRQGRFMAKLQGNPPPGAALKIRVTASGFQEKVLDTQSDVPDFGVVLEKGK